MTPDQLPSAFFDLLATKKYTDLSIQEKELVHQFMDADEYNAMQTVVLNFRTLDQEIEVLPSTIPVQADQPSILTQLLTYPIPAYQVAAGFLLLFGSLFVIQFYTQNQEAKSVQTEVQEKGIPVEEDSYPSELIFNL